MNKIQCFLINYVSEDILKNYKWYRKAKGGTWYHVKERDAGGFASGVDYWTRNKPDNNWDIEIKKEEYAI